MSWRLENAQFAMNILCSYSYGPVFGVFSMYNLCARLHLHPMVLAGGCRCPEAIGATFGAQDILRPVRARAESWKLYEIIKVQCLEHCSKFHRKIMKNLIWSILIRYPLVSNRTRHCESRCDRSPWPHPQAVIEGPPPDTHWRFAEGWGPQHVELRKWSKRCQLRCILQIYHSDYLRFLPIPSII